MEKCRTFVVVLLGLGVLVVLLLAVGLSGTEQCHDDTSLRVNTNGSDEHLSAALHDMGAGEEHGLIGALLDQIRLAGERRLVDLEIV